MSDRLDLDVHMSNDDPTDPASSAAVSEEDGAVDSCADGACWIARVCDPCGALPDGPPGPACWRCGSATVVQTAP